MANNITRMPRQQVMGPQQQGVPSQQWWGGMPGWGGPPWWDFDDSNCPGNVPPFPCPPPGFPPPGCPPWFSGANSPPWYPGANAGVSFGSTFPPNPVRGHFFWDGGTLWMFDGAAWVATGGAISSTTPPSTSPPANPAAGQQWFNGTTLYVWDGNAWVPVSATKSTISATAPPAPNAGDTWWDGTQMRIWDGSAWELVGPGATVGPVGTTTQVLSVSNSGYLTAPTTWGAPLGITATPIVDTMTGFDPVTKKYTPKKSGVYLFQTMLWQNATGGTAILYNDQGTFTDSTVDPVVCVVSQSSSGYLQANAMHKMNGTTDFVRLFAFSSAAQVWGEASPPMLGAWLMP
jgi:hypothetical protein